MLKRGVHVDVEALNSQLLARQYQEEEAQKYRPDPSVQSNPYSSSFVKKKTTLPVGPTQPRAEVKLGQRQQGFVNEVQVRIASKELERKVREEALRRVGYY